MARLDDVIADLKKKMGQAQLPPDFEARISDLFEQIDRVRGDITSRVYVDSMLRYIDWAVNLPWNSRTQDIVDLVRTQEYLDKNHYGLQPVKDRILEFLSVIKLHLDKASASGIVPAQNPLANTDDARSAHVALDAKLSHSILARRAPIILLVGLVGTGKTTLAKSIAQATGRRFVRIPFGGMSSALDLRGQSRVHADAEIGLVLKAMRFAGTKNPVLLLDEIDRVSERTRGEIMGVLVELLDPEQNAAFLDHYLDYPFDLSEVLFVATSNNTTSIATAVMDRMEPIQMPSYTDEEKITIAKRYVLPSLMKETGLTGENLTIDDSLWNKMVRPLGYDAGIRTIERTLVSVCRKVARNIVEGKGNSFHITAENIKQFVDSY